MVVNSSSYTRSFFPSCPIYLAGLMKLQTCGTPSVRDITIELCLTVPARLVLSAPVHSDPDESSSARALQAADEQVVKLGLRTLEFWVDNLNPDYLYPHMCPVLNELMRSLTALLRPLPSPFGQTALSVLGKLGGRNRRFFIEYYQLQHKKTSGEEAWNVDLAFAAALGADGEPIMTPPGVDTAMQFSLNLDRTVETARAMLVKDYPPPYSYYLPQQLQSHPTQTLSYTASLNEDGTQHQFSSINPAYIMQQKLIQKYNAFLYLKSVLVSMLDLKGDFAAFLPSLPPVESSSVKAERLKREKEREERERAEAMEDEYTGPPQMNPHVQVAVAVSSRSGSAPASSAAIVPMLSRPRGPQMIGDAEGAAIASRFQHASTREMFKQLVQSMIIAASDPYLKKMDTTSTATATPNSESEVEPFLNGLLTHFAMVAVHLPASASGLEAKLAAKCDGTMPNFSYDLTPPASTDEEKAAAAEEEKRAAHAEYASFAAAPAFEIYHLDLGLFLDALFNTLGEENRYWSSAALLALRHFLTTFLALVGPDQASTAPVVTELLARFIHGCYEDKWEQRHAGIIGLSLLVKALPSTWQFAHSGEIIKALLFTFKDEPSAFSDLSTTRAHSVLEEVIRSSAALAQEVWERRRGKAGQEEAAAAAAGQEEEEKTGAGEDEAGLGSEDGAPSTQPVVAEVTEPPSIIRQESDITGGVTAAASATNTDMDIHMVDASADDSKAAPVGTSSSEKKPPSSSEDVEMKSSEQESQGKNAFNPHKSPIIMTLVRHVLYELYASVAAVRDEAHELLKLLGSCINRSVAHILEPVKHQLLQPVRQKSMHQYPLATRIGYISAATFALSMPKPNMSMKDLKYLVQEVLNDNAEDHQNHGMAHFNTRQLKSQLVAKLRVESIHLMSVAICTEEVSRDRPDEDKSVREEKRTLKENVIRIFFRSLMSRSAEVVKVAKTGLKAVIAHEEHEKLPKDLLQQCLRPVLLNLADYRKLSVILLEGLSRLLELLSSCFNVTLGEKLLEHLRNFADYDSLQKMRLEALNAEKAALATNNPQVIQQAQMQKIRPEDEVKIAVSIIDLFHLLPPALDPPTAGSTIPPQSKFLEPLVKYTLALEDMLPVVQLSAGMNISAYPPSKEELASKSDASTATTTPTQPAHPYTHSTDTGISSPYRAPLIKFLNVNPYRSCEYFLRSSLLSTKSRQMFLSILKDVNAAPLRKCLHERPDLLANWTFRWSEHHAPTLLAQINAQQAAQQAAQAAQAAAASAATNNANSSSSAGASSAGASGSTTSAPMDTSSGSGTAAAPVTSSTDASASTTTAPAVASTSGGEASSSAAGTTAATGASTSAPATSTSAKRILRRSSSGRSPPVLPQSALLSHIRWLLRSTTTAVCTVYLVTLILSSFQPQFLTAVSPSAPKAPTILQHLFEVWDSPQRKGRTCSGRNRTRRIDWRIWMRPGCWWSACSTMSVRIMVQ